VEVEGKKEEEGRREGGESGPKFATRRGGGVEGDGEGGEERRKAENRGQRAKRRSEKRGERGKRKRERELFLFFGGRPTDRTNEERKRNLSASLGAGGTEWPHQREGGRAEAGCARAAAALAAPGPARPTEGTKEGSGKPPPPPPLGARSGPAPSMGGWPGRLRARCTPRCCYYCRCCCACGAGACAAGRIPDFCSAFQLSKWPIQQALSCFQCAYARLLAMSPQCHALQVLHISSRHGQSLNRLNCISNRAASPHGRDSSSLRWPSLRKSGQILVSPPGHPPLDVTFLFLDQLALLLIFSRERALSR
jgi:hypothetical protein